MKNKKILFALAFSLLLATILAVSAFAAAPSSGYMKNSQGTETNIKWTMTE